MGSLIVFPVAAALAVLGKRKFEETAFPAIGAVTFIMMLFGMIGHLKAGFYVLPVLLIASVVVLVMKRAEVRKYVLTPGLPAFVVCIIFFLLFSYKRYFTFDSALAHYGLAVRHMFESGTMKETGAYRDLNFPLPAVSVWAYLSSWPEKDFSQWKCILFYDVFIISALLPLFGRIKSVKEETWQWLLMIVFCIFLPLLKLPLAYASFDMAVPQAASVVYAFLMFHQIFSVKLKNVSKWWYAGLSAYGVIMACILTRYGIYALIPLFMMMASLAVSDTKMIRFMAVSAGAGILPAVLISVYGYSASGAGAGGAFTILLCCLVSIFLGVIIAFTMKLYEKDYRLPTMLIMILIGAVIAAAAFAMLKRGTNSEYLTEWFIEYTDKLFGVRSEETDYLIGRRAIPVRDGVFLFIMMIVFGIASGKLGKKSPDKAAAAHAINAAFVFGMYTYLSVLCVLYINVIRHPHMGTKPSIAIYILPVAVFAGAAAFMQSFRAWKKDTVIAVGAIAVTICVFSDPVGAMFDRPAYEDPYPLIDACEDAGVLELGAEDRVFFIDKDLTEDLPAEFTWTVYPAGADLINGLYFNPEPSKWNDEIEEPLTPEELADIIDAGGYTYVYLKNTDDFFYRTYYKDFANWGIDIRNDAIYRVEHDESGQMQIAYIAGVSNEEDTEEEQ